MIDVFGQVKSLVQLEDICIDNNVFRLHYKVTGVILIMASLLVTSRQYIGDPIDCIVEEIPPDVMDTYCWIHSTFSVPGHEIGIAGEKFVYPGVGTHSNGPDDEQQLQYHKYYQWICFTLFFQAILFYVPRYLWKTWENGRIKMLVQDMNVPILDQETKRDRIKLIIDYFTVNRRNHQLYTLKFLFCEALNLMNVVGQIYFIDFFLGGEFTTYGLDVVNMTEMKNGERDDPMARMFPKITKCTFNKFGPSGTVEKFDGLCVLPLNIINEKIYVFLWFWFVFLAIVTGLHLTFRLAVSCLPVIREILLRTRARLAPSIKVESICRESGYGDWFILYQLGKNMDPIIFKDFVNGLHQRLETLKVAERPMGSESRV